MIRLLIGIAAAICLLSRPSLAVTGDDAPKNVPGVVASHIVGGNCEKIFRDYQSALEPKAYAQSPDGKRCGANFETKENYNSAQPRLGHRWDGVMEQAIRNCKGSTQVECVVVMTNNKTWTTWVSQDEWKLRQNSQRPTATPTSFSNTDEGAGGRYTGKVSTKNTATNEPWERPISFSIGANAFTGHPDNAPNVKIEGGILPGGKVQGTLYGGKTNYAIEGQVTKMANGQRLFRATLRPLEPNVTITGTIEAVADAEGASNTTAPSNLYVIPPKQ